MKGELETKHLHQVLQDGFKFRVYNEIAYKTRNPHKGECLIMAQISTLEICSEVNEVSNFCALAK